MAVRKQYLLRIDPDVWTELEKWAADDLRSVNAQVEYVLRDALRARGRARAGAGAERQADEASAPGSAGDDAG